MAPTLLRRRGQQAVTSLDPTSKAAPMRMLGAREEVRGDRLVRVAGSAGRLLGCQVLRSACPYTRWPFLSGLASKGPSEGSSIRPTGFVTWAALRGG
jgi:hypothetical protein